MIRMIEAFRSGKAGEMMGKIARVLGRRIGSTITLSPEAYSYKNKFGTFDGYFGIIDDGDKMIRFNVFLGSSDEIVSVDLYLHSISIVPDLTLETQGMNIIQILDYITKTLENPVAEVFEERVKKGVNEIPLKGKEAEDFNTLMKVSAEDLFEQLKDYVYLIHKRTVNALYIYGPPGAGKSRTVIHTLDNLGANYEIFSGGVKGTSELVRLLHRYKDGSTILVFDDFDSSMRNREQKNILKSVLQDEGLRMVTYIKDVKYQRTIPERFEVLSPIIFISNISKVDPAIKSRCMNLHIELSQEEMLLRIKNLIENIYTSFPIGIKMKVWRFLMRASKQKKLKRIDFRQFKFCLAISALILDKYPTSRKWKQKCLVMLNA